MSRNPSSLLWLNSKYSRTKGQIARNTALINHVEARLKFHRHHMQRCEAKLIDLQAGLAESLRQVEQLARALELHTHAPSVDEIHEIRPHEHPPFFKRGGMTTAIYQTLKSTRNGVLTIDELQTQLSKALNLALEDTPRLRMRLQMRLHGMLHEGKVVSLDGNWVVGRRWMLSKNWEPAVRSVQRKHKPGHQPRHRSQGSIQPARWLIQSQLDISSIQNGDVAAGDVDLASKLGADLGAISAVWKQHPLHFDVDLEKIPSPRSIVYRASVNEGIFKILAQANRWLTVIDLQAACRSSGKKWRVSINAISTALRQLLLEGRVEQRQCSAGAQVEWRLCSSVGESINTSVRQPRRS